MRVGIALGSNVGDSLAHLRHARQTILHLPDVNADDCLIAPAYRTAPVDCPPGTGDFLNSVMEVGYEGNAADLLQALHGIETDLGRPSVHGINESRSIDLDLLYADDLVLMSRELILPHPRMLRRRFVLAPLVRIRPDLVLPGQTEPVTKILDRLDDDPASVALVHEHW